MLGLQYENLEAVLDRVQNEEEFVYRWLAVTRANINRNRRKSNELILMEECGVQQEEQAAKQQYQCHNLIYQRTIFRKLEYV